MIQRLNKPVIVVFKIQELLQFLNIGGNRPVLHKLDFVLIHL